MNSFLFILLLTVDWPGCSTIFLNFFGARYMKSPSLNTLAIRYRWCSTYADQPHYALWILLLNFDLCPRFLNIILLQSNYKNFQLYILIDSLDWDKIYDELKLNWITWKDLFSKKKKRRKKGINEKIYTMMSFDRFYFTKTHWHIIESDWNFQQLLSLGCL